MLSSYIFLLILSFQAAFAASTALETVSCPAVLRPAGKAGWRQAAHALRLAIKNKKHMTFPAEVNGYSLIPPEYLREITDPVGEGSKGKKVEIDRVDSILLEEQKTLAFGSRNTFAVVIKYYKKGQKTPSFEANSSVYLDEWIDYLAEAKNNSFKPFKIAELNKKSDGSLGRLSSNDNSAVENSSFYVWRTLSEYDDAFGGELIKYLNLFAKKGGHWVDMGAGEGLALLEYYRRRSSKKMRMTGVGYDFVAGWGSDTGRAIKKSRGRFRYVEGYLTLESGKEIGMANVITDHYGIHHYTKNRNRFELLNLYASILSPGGIIFTDSGISEGTRSKLLRAHPDIQITEKDGYSTIVKSR